MKKGIWAFTGYVSLGLLAITGNWETPIWMAFILGLPAFLWLTWTAGIIFKD